MKSKPRGAQRRTSRRTELGRTSEQVARRLAREVARPARLEDETTAALEGAALLMSGFALFAFTCAARSAA